MRTEFDMRPSSKTSRTYPSAFQQLFGLAVPTQDAATQSTKNFNKLLKYCKTKDDMKLFRGQNMFSDSADSLPMMKFDCTKYEENEPKLFKLYCSKRHSRPYEKIKITKTISERPLFYKMYCSRPKYIKNKGSDYSLNENLSNLFKKRKTKKCFCVCKHFFEKEFNKIQPKKPSRHSDHEGSNLKIHLEKSDFYDESTTIIVPKNQKTSGSNIIKKYSSSTRRRREKWSNPIELSPWKKMMLMSAVSEDRFLHPDIPQGVKKPNYSRQSVKNYSHPDIPRRHKYKTTDSDDSSTISKLTESSVGTSKSGSSRKKAKTSKDRPRKEKQYRKPEKISSGIYLENEGSLKLIKNDGPSYKPEMASGLVMENKRPVRTVRKFKNESEVLLNDISQEKVKKPSSKRSPRIDNSSSDDKLREKPAEKKPSERSNPAMKQRDRRYKEPEYSSSTSRDRIRNDNLSGEMPSRSQIQKPRSRDRDDLSQRDKSREKVPSRRQIQDPRRNDETLSQRSREKVPSRRRIQDPRRNDETLSQRSREKVPSTREIQDPRRNEENLSQRDRSRDRVPSRSLIQKPRDRKNDENDQKGRSRENASRSQIPRKNDESDRDRSRDRAPSRSQIREREPQSRDRISRSDDKLSQSRDREPQKFRSTSRDRLNEKGYKEPQEFRSRSRDRVSKSDDKLSQKYEPQISSKSDDKRKEPKSQKRHQHRKEPQESQRQPQVFRSTSRDRISKSDDKLSQSHVAQISSKSDDKQRKEPKSQKRHQHRREPQESQSRDKQPQVFRSTSRDRLPTNQSKSDPLSRNKSQDKLTSHVKSPQRYLSRDRTDHSARNDEKPSLSGDNLTKSDDKLKSQNSLLQRADKNQKLEPLRSFSPEKTKKLDDKLSQSRDSIIIHEKKSQSRDRETKKSDNFDWSEKRDPVERSPKMASEGFRARVDENPIQTKRSSLLKNVVRDTTDPKLLRLNDNDLKMDEEPRSKRSPSNDPKLKSHIVVTHLGQTPKEHSHPYTYQIPKDTGTSEEEEKIQRKSPTRQDESKKMDSIPKPNTIKENPDPFNYPIPKMSSVPKTGPNLQRSRPNSRLDVSQRNERPIQNSFKPQPLMQYKSEKKYADKSIQTTGIIMDYHESRVFSNTVKPKQDAKIGGPEKKSEGSGDNSSAENRPTKKRLRRDDLYHDLNRGRKGGTSRSRKAPSSRSRDRPKKPVRQEVEMDEKDYKRLRKTKESKRSRDRDKAKASRGKASSSSRGKARSSSREKVISSSRGKARSSSRGKARSSSRGKERSSSRGKARSSSREKAISGSRGKQDKKKKRRKAKSSNTSKSRGSSKSKKSQKRRKSRKRQRKGEIFECICTPIKSEEHFEIDCILVDEPVKKSKLDKYTLTDLRFNCQIDYEEGFSPVNYSLSKKDVREKYGSVPPFWVLFENLISVVWALNNPTKRGPGIVQLNWALEFLRSTEENGKYVEPIGSLIKAIEVDIMRRYCDLKKMHLVSLYGQN